MKSINLFRSVMTVGFWTLLSRILGMVREILLSSFIGAGPVLDAFIAAFRLPNMFRRFFAEGAFNTAFVPMFSKRFAGNDNAQNFASDALSGLFAVLMIFTALGMIFMPVLVYATAQGFVGDSRFDLTVEFGRVMFPYILLISLAALFSGALNAMGYFAAAAAAPVFLNIILVGALLGSWVLNIEPTLWLIWAVPISGIVQLVFVWWATKTTGLSVKITRPKWNTEMRQLVGIAIPAALSGGVLQINALVGQIVASQDVGAVSWLYFADRLYQLPLGVAAIAIGIVLLPELSRQLRLNDHHAAHQAYSSAAELTFTLSLPAAVALCVVPLPIAAALYEHGATGRSDTQAIALATAIYGLGLPAFMLQKILLPLFFAREDTKRPLRYSILSMFINAGLAVGLMPTLGWIGVAIAASFAAWVTTIMLWWGSREYGQTAKLSNSAVNRSIRCAGAAVIMGVILWCLSYFFFEQLNTSLTRIIFGFSLVIIGAIIYGMVGKFLGAFSLSELKRQFKRNT